MKAFLTILLFCLFAWAGTKVCYAEAFAEASAEVLVVQEAGMVKSEVCDGAFIPFNAERTPLDMLRGDSRRAHRIGVSLVRMHRFTSIQTISFIKTLLRKMAIHMDNLVECRARVFDVANLLGWNNACEYYVYGMRRILI